MERERLLRVARRTAVALEWAYAVALLGLALLTHWWELDWFGLWLVATFFPYWFLPGLALTGWALLRRCPRRHLPALLVTATFLVLYGRQLLPSWPRRDAGAMVVMTYNTAAVRGGPGPALAVVDSVRPHLLALQEVRPPRPDGSSLVSRLQAAGYQCEQRPYYADTALGVALCARQPAWLLQVQRRTYHEQGEWSYLFAEAAWQGQVVNVVVPHLLSYRIRGPQDLEQGVSLVRRLRRASRWHRQETAALLELVTGFRDPTLMLGDFNSTPEHAIHARIRGRLRDAFRTAGFGLGATYRFLLPIRIDYIYVGPGVEVLAARVGPAGASDHRPVVAEVRLVAAGR